MDPSVFEPEAASSHKFWYVARSVLASPAAMIVWVAGGALAVWLHSWLFVGLTVAAEAAILWWRLHDEEYLRHLFAKRRQHEETLSEQQIELALDQMDFETRQRVRYILQLQKEVAREARASDVEEYAKQDLDRIASQLMPLVQRAVRMAIRKQQLAKYLQNVDEKALQSYCTSLEQRIASTTDEVAKAQYEQALKARRAELQTYQAIAQASSRIDSQLENVEATFANWKARVIRIKTADVAGAATASQDLLQELGALNNEIDLLDSSVSEALAGEQPASLHSS
ncbi:MAG: hypothetical protein ACP5VE_11315 [Chthonomonadales bacterium]